MRDISGAIFPIFRVGGHPDEGEEDRKRSTAVRRASGGGGEPCHAFIDGCDEVEFREAGGGALGVAGAGPRTSPPSWRTTPHHPGNPENDTQEAQTGTKTTKTKILAR